MTNVILNKYGIAPKKRFGQNFLVNKGVLEKIVRGVAPRQDEPLLEIGPGVGELTRKLAETGAFVTAIEADSRMVEVLQAELGNHPNVRIVYGDILEVDLQDVVSDSDPTDVQRLTRARLRCSGGTNDVVQKQWRVVGNIPYNISSPILFLLRDHRHLFSEAILMLQKEVADRLTADVGTKDYGLLTVGLGVVGTCKQLFDVSPGSFWPSPKVTSTVVKISLPEPPPYPGLDLDLYTKVVRTAFGKRRKTIRNAMAMGTGAVGLPQTPRQVDEALAAAGISADRRAETIAIAEYVALTQTIGTCGRLY